MSHDVEKCLDDVCVADLSVGALRDIVGGQLRHGEMPALAGDDSPVRRIVRDASAIERGDVFWAKDGRPGDRCASEFAYEALMRGAEGVVTNCPVEPWSGRWSIYVGDPSRALSKLATWNRERFTGRAIGVTGSVGKSTTLAMIEAVLKSRLIGTACEIGVGGEGSGAEVIERGVLGLEPLDDFAMFELAGDTENSLTEISEICRPEVAVVTNLAHAQMGMLALRMAIADAHGNFLSELPTSGVAVLPGDDPWVRRIAMRSSAPVVWFGRGGDCDFCATDVECRGESIRFSVEGVRISVPVWGRHLLDCALAAYAVGRHLSFSPHEIADALAEFQPLPHRCNVLGVAGRGSGVRERSETATASRMDIAAYSSARRISVIDDSLGASAAAARAALQLLRDFHAPGRRVVVMGDLEDAREGSVASHQQLGEEVVSSCGADLLVACGHRSSDLVAGAVAAGMPARRALSVHDASEAATLINGELSAGDVLLIHGRSRFSVSQFLNQIGVAAESRAA